MDDKLSLYEILVILIATLISIPFIGFIILTAFAIIVGSL